MKLNVSFDPKVEVIPPTYNNNNDRHIYLLQRNKWRVLGITFTIVFMVLLVGVWTRPAIYQSQALLHFSYAQSIGQSTSLVPTEQISLNQQRLNHLLPPRYVEN